MTDQFTGSDAEIFYCFHGEDLEEGDVIKGSFSVVSNRGEYNLPFVVTVEHGMLNSSIGAIRNLFHFANLAKNNWKEAVRLFYDPEFCGCSRGTMPISMTVTGSCPLMRATNRMWKNS